ncbi:DUF6194 family protein [Nonomuraea sp. NPDC003804]|uniref:DUF6194 family protein n=1 Tax=Nonomuraea sp. NPDC003804 TaxID=3154547 RepID=UPI0033AD1714
MTENDIIDFVSGLPATVAITAGEDNGTPEAAWGDTFFFYAPEGTMPTDGRLPYATVVVKDYPGWDTASGLDRPGVFRLNIAVGRAAFEELIGYPPAAHADHHAGVDYTATDRIIPHPLYAVQGWICVLNPGEATGGQAYTLLNEAHARAAKRYRPGR